MNLLLGAWDHLAKAIARLLRKAPEDSRIMVAAILSHSGGNVETISIISNVPQLITVQALDMAATAARNRPQPEEGEEFLPTLAPKTGGILVVMETREMAA